MKKGFTLVEMLGVIAVLAVILLVTFPALSKSLKTTKENENKNFLNNIKVSAEAYIELNRDRYPELDSSGIALITVKDLYDANLLKGNFQGVDINDKITVLKNSENVLEYYYSNVANQYLFDYTGSEEEFVVSQDGLYVLETWGAQGGNMSSAILTDFPSVLSVHGGYGGYSIGCIQLVSGQNIFINVGGQGGFADYSLTNIDGGYNGGGSGGHGAIDYWKNSRGKDAPLSSSGGGGATSISFASGLISQVGYEQSILENKLLLASGGGGGVTVITFGCGGSGGGIKGEDGIVFSGSYTNGGTQTTGYSFGIGQDGHNSIQGTNNDAEGSGGGGGGLYGGFSYQGTESKSDAHGAGGSGYIGNSIITNKYMTCYNCEESNETSTKTINITNEAKVTEQPISGNPKKGNGYARITYLGKSI